MQTVQDLIDELNALTWTYDVGTEDEVGDTGENKDAHDFVPHTIPVMEVSGNVSLNWNVPIKVKDKGFPTEEAYFFGSYPESQLNGAVPAVFSEMEATLQQNPETYPGSRIHYVDERLGYAIVSWMMTRPNGRKREVYHMWRANNFTEIADFNPESIRHDIRRQR